MLKEQIKNRKAKSQSRNKLVSMVELYEKYVDEDIKTIEIWSPTSYFINEKWTVDISLNKVERTYPDPEY